MRGLRVQSPSEQPTPPLPPPLTDMQITVRLGWEARLHHPTRGPEVLLAALGPALRVLAGLVQAREEALVKDGWRLDGRGGDGSGGCRLGSGLARGVSEGCLGAVARKLTLALDGPALAVAAALGPNVFVKKSSVATAMSLPFAHLSSRRQFAPRPRHPSPPTSDPECPSGAYPGTP